MSRYFPKIRGELIKKRGELSSIEKKVFKIIGDIELHKSRSEYGLANKLDDARLLTMNEVKSIKREIAELEKELLGEWMPKKRKKKTIARDSHKRIE